jgi:STE24 endopeptidase
MPFSIYRTFVIEEKYGFNKTTAKTFVCDTVKSLMLIVVFTALLTPLILWVIDVAGDSLVVSLVTVAIVVILIF